MGRVCVVSCFWVVVVSVFVVVIGGFCMVCFGDMVSSLCLVCFSVWVCWVSFVLSGVLVVSMVGCFVMVLISVVEWAGISVDRRRFFSCRSVCMP